MKWENGSCLALNVEEDRFDIITKQDEIAEIKQQEFIDKINEILWMRMWALQPPSES